MFRSEVTVQDAVVAVSVMESSMQVSHSVQELGPIKYCQISNIRGTKSQNVNVSRRLLQLCLPNPLKPGVQLRMKM